MTIYTIVRPDGLVEPAWLFTSQYKLERSIELSCRNISEPQRSEEIKKLKAAIKPLWAHDKIEHL